MKICLAFTPFVYNEPPLGIAALKSYLRDTVPGADVKTIDLNMRFFQRMGSRGTGLSCTDCPSSDVACRPPQCLVPDAQLGGLYGSLKDRRTLRRDGKRFPSSAFEFQGHFRAVWECYIKQLTDYLERGELTEACRTVLQDDAELLLSEKPDVVGFSVLTTYNLPYALALARYLKTQADVPVLLGGPIMTHMDPGEILRGCDFIDYIVQGEGEESLRVFLEQFPRVRPERVPNLAYRDGDEIRCNEQAFVAELDKLPFPDFSDYELNEYLMPGKFLLVSTSRGCYWGKCAFCVHYKSYARGMRAKSVERFVDELEFYGRRYGITRFFITDDMLSPDRITRISDEILRRKLRVYLAIDVRPEKGMTHAVLKKAYKAGFTWMFWGVETFTQRVLDAIEKDTRIEEIVAVVRRCRKIGIKAYLSVIAGLPPVTEQEFRRELELVRRITGYPCVRYGRFYLFHGSPMAADPKAFGINVIERKKDFTINGVTIHCPEYRYDMRNGFMPDYAIKLAWGALPDRLQVFYRGYDFLLSTVGFDFASAKREQFADLTRRRITAAAGFHAALRPAGPHARYLAGLGQFILGRYEQAVREFEQAGRQAGGWPFRQRLAYYIGLCRRNLRQYDAAMAAFGNVGPAIAAHHLFIKEKAVTEYYRRNYPEAAAQLEQVLSPCSGDADTHYILGACYAKTGDFERAIPALLRAERLSPLLPDINMLLAACYRAAGRRKESVAEMQRSLLKLKEWRGGSAVAPLFRPS